jgi:Na+(H+)/acetate symporter ActP
LVFIFFQFQRPPVHFNSANLQKIEGTAYEDDLVQLEQQHTAIFDERQGVIQDMVGAIRQDDEAAISAAQTQIAELDAQDDAIRSEVKDLILTVDPASKTEDTDYVFITFVINYLPVGLVGLLLAVIFSAAMSSTSSELNALATTTVIDLYRRSLSKDKSDGHYLRASRWFTIMWGVVALIFALTANLFENLIQAVNIIGSLFYGAILGIFLVAFFLKQVGSRAVFLAALIGESIILIIFYLTSQGIIELAYLWLNLIGCALVMVLAYILYLLGMDKPKPGASEA